MAETRVPERFAQHLASEAMGGRCTLVAFKGEADEFENPSNRGRCPGAAVAVKWEDGFADDVCERHAQNAETRSGVVVVRPQRHDGHDLAAPVPHPAATDPSDA